jgi:hypothetical protein
MWAFGLTQIQPEGLAKNDKKPEIAEQMPLIIGPTPGMKLAYLPTSATAFDTLAKSLDSDFLLSANALTTASEVCLLEPT